MRNGCITLFALSLASASLAQAQTPHFGGSLNINIPVGDLASKTYAPTLNVPVPQKETYDIGLGGQFTASFPVDPHLAFRLDVFGQSEDGRNQAVGYEDVNLRHQIFGIAGEAQIFLGNGNANRYRGAYLLAGVSADFERFDFNYYDNYDYYGSYTSGSSDTTKKSRMGLMLGIGHAFGMGGSPRFTMEAVYHKSLTGTAAGDPPSTDFLRLGFGVMF